MEADTIFDAVTCSDLAVASGKEWIETNGLGGYASATITGLNTRRYHGMLVAATKPPLGRMVLVGKLEETIRIRGRPFELATNRYPGVVYPAGYRFQKEFRLDPWPTFVFAIEGTGIEKTVFMVHGENTTVVSYRLLNCDETGVHLQLIVLIAARDFHSLMRANPRFDGRLCTGPGWAAITPYTDVPTIYVNYENGRVLPGGDWYYRLQYEQERQRAFPFEEDLYHACSLELDLTARGVSVILSTTVRDPAQAESLRSSERARRAALSAGDSRPESFVRKLLCAADQFVVRRGMHEPAIVAGYHWFGEWGRDTMISIPGLLLVPRRFDLAREILEAYTRYCSEGMIPNYFPEPGGEPEYNTADGTLWFVQAVYEYARRSGDYNFVRDKLYPTLTAILHRHIAGTRFHIKMAPDGLLESGEPGLALTWMDARVEGQAVSPRAGKPVEIQALWFNALRVLEHFAYSFGDQVTGRLCGATAEKAQDSFNRQFWNPEARCLYDCITEGRPDSSVRPNQILAASLPFTMLPEQRLQQVVACVNRELLTPYGLRSLSPRDSRYQGCYHGNAAARDAQYHQGTVWSWLMGPYICAHVRAAGGNPAGRAEARELLSALHAHLRDAGLGTISEIFDGDPPHTPKGAIGQAWSVAELLRVLVN